MVPKYVIEDDYLKIRGQIESRMDGTVGIRICDKGQSNCFYAARCSSLDKAYALWLAKCMEMMATR